jgi:FtsH-binding integral membrane protein
MNLSRENTQSYSRQRVVYMHQVLPLMTAAWVLRHSSVISASNMPYAVFVHQYPSVILMIVGNLRPEHVHSGTIHMILPNRHRLFLLYTA